MSFNDFPPTFFYIRMECERVLGYGAGAFENKFREKVVNVVKVI